VYSEIIFFDAVVVLKYFIIDYDPDLFVPLGLCQEFKFMAHILWNPFV
jgi:hypothetical protein